MKSSLLIKSRSCAPQRKVRASLRMAPVWGIWLFLSGIAVAGEQASDPARVTAEAVDKKYNAMQTLKADFVQIYAGAGRVRRESGTLWLKQPGRMRWDYQQPQQKLLVADGKNAYFYVPEERQVR